jgi:ribosomal-protein-alanine N-acetyltransferase
MTPADLARLHAAAFASPRPWSEAEFANLLGGSGTLLVSAPEGFALGRALAGEAELLTIAVARAARRQGIGARLLRDFLAEAAACGAGTVFLEVAEDNAAARALYRAAGFAEAGRRRGYYLMPDGCRTDALVLRREGNRPAPDI